MSDIVTIREIVDGPRSNTVLTRPITVVIQDRADGAINWDLDESTLVKATVSEDASVPVPSLYQAE